MTASAPDTLLAAMPCPPSERFLEIFRQSTATGRGLEVIADDAGGFARAPADQPEAMLDAINIAADRAGGAASVPRAVFATAAVRRAGGVVACDAAFTALNLSEEALAHAVQDAGREPLRLSSILDDAGGRPVAVVLARLERARSWPLVDAVRKALDSGVATFAVMGVGPTDAVDWAALFSP